MLNYQTYGRNRSRFSRQNRRRNDNLEQQASSILSDWARTYPCRTYKLSDICKYVSAKCDTGNLTLQNYISTENMLPNKKGIDDASNIPTGKVTCFKVDDILIANIRPYFQKIWKADISGGCSTDVLCIRSCVESHSPILYWILHQDAFFEYVMTGAKGCKMPRGDKGHIMDWEIDIPENKSEQTAIGLCLKMLDKKIEINKQINDNLEQQAQALYKSWFIDNYQTEWPEYSLDEVTLKITDGVHNTVIDTPNGEYYLLSCKNIKNRRLNMSSSDRRIDEGTFNKLRKRTMMSKGDILLSSVGTIGELMLLNEDPHNYEFQRSVAIIKPNPVYISSYYLYETLISQIDKINNTDVWMEESANADSSDFKRE